MSKNICIDLDGVLAVHDKWEGIHYFGPVIDGAKEFLQQLKDWGLYVIIYSVRGNSEFNELPPKELQKIMEDWLNENELPYDDVFVGQGKPHALAYVDDRAIYCDPLVARIPGELGSYNDVLNSLVSNFGVENE